MHLFRTEEELERYMPARLTINLSDLQSVMEDVQQEYLAEAVLGSAQLDDLIDALESQELDDAQEKVLHLCRRVVAPLTCYHYTGLANVAMGDSGLVTTGSSDKYVPASEWRTRDFERTQLRQGYRALDVLIAHLLANPEDLDGWDETPQAARLRSGWIRGTATFNGLVHIGNSGWLYSRMAPTRARIEQEVVSATICSADYEQDLRQRWLADQINVTERELVRHIQRAVAHLTMADSIVELSLRMDQQGVWTFSSLMGQTSGGPMPASDVRIQHQIDQHRTIGQAALAKVRETLQAMATADPTHPYRSSKCYQPPSDPADRFQTDNKVGGFLA